MKQAPGYYCKKAAVAEASRPEKFAPLRTARKPEGAVLPAAREVPGPTPYLPHNGSSPRGVGLMRGSLAPEFPFLIGFALRTTLKSQENIRDSAQPR